MNLTQPHPHLLEGVEIKRGYLNFLVTKYERKWILCVREHMMDCTLAGTQHRGNINSSLVIGDARNALRNTFYLDL